LKDCLNQEKNVRGGDSAAQLSYAIRNGLLTELCCGRIMAAAREV
jgi:hypothetical protein